MSVRSTVTSSQSASAANGAVPESLSLPLRVAIVGCGAVTEKKHLPALQDSHKVKVTALMDLDANRARQVASQFGVPIVCGHANELRAHADIAIVAVPHHLHAAVAVDLMRAGLHVFVEKPLATNMRDVAMVLEEAARSDRRVGVGLMRRQYSAFRFVQDVLKSGWIGQILSFDFREGGPFNWPVATPATFSRRTAGGVLFDTGAHTLDMLLSWLGPFQEVRYFDDSRGGVEANCRLELVLASGVHGVVEMSRTRTLRNSYIITGDRGEIEIGATFRGPVALRSGSMAVTSTPSYPDGREYSPLDFMRLQVEEFATALIAGQDWSSFAEHTTETIRLFDVCQDKALALQLPWEDYLGSETLPDFAGRRVLVLGGTGFIGGRLVAVLAQQTTAKVRVLARDLSRLSNVSRFDVEVVSGDASDPKALAAAMSGCDVVVNCTIGRGDRRAATRLNVDAVRTIVEEAARAGIQRVVHLSTVSAYGVPASGELSESSTLEADRSFIYGYTKRQGEIVALEAAKRLGCELRILQPTVVYGPGAPSWTINPIRMLRSGRVPLIDGGHGVCNAVYIDDVVQAIMLAATVPAGAGERFLINGPTYPTWREFYAAYEAMLGFESTTEISLADLTARRRELARRAATRAQLLSLITDPIVFKRLASLAVVKKFKTSMPSAMLSRIRSTTRKFSSQARPEAAAKPLHVLTETDAEFQASAMRVSSEKAASIIGYAPRFDLDAGMRRTREWAIWANIV